MAIDLKFSEESGFDDTQTVVSDIKELARKFINPIDRLRSLSKPGNIGQASRTQKQNESELDFVTRNDFENLEINVNRPMESRAHAFYRMIGLPVMAPNGSFYNPGFEPDSIAVLSKKTTVNDAILSDQLLQAVLNNRELDVQSRRNIFAKQNINSTAYALALRHIRPFSTYFDTSTIGQNPLSPDPQKFTINERIFELATFTGKSSSFENQRHILRPFIVDPKIANTINPVQNIICVPFLRNSESTKIFPDVSLKRPAIEYICRIRLSQQNDTSFLNEVERLISGSTNNSDSSQSLRNTILALSGTDDLNTIGNNNNFFNMINDFSSIQANTVNTLIKTIRGVLVKLDTAIRVFDLIKPEINFQPIPNTEGPEFGGIIRTVGGGSAPSELDQKIAILKILNLNAQTESRILSERIGGGSELFAVSTIMDGQKNYDEEIGELTRHRNDLAGQALSSMTDIEIITGEVSGLGLIDILAIYTALWAIDIEALIGLLDDRAFDRLFTFNPELRTTEVNSRRNGGGISGFEGLKIFEKVLFNIFSFIDREFENLQKSPNESQFGNIR